MKKKSVYTKIVAGKTHYYYAKVALPRHSVKEFCRSLCAGSITPATTILVPACFETPPLSLSLKLSHGRFK